MASQFWASEGAIKPQTSHIQLLAKLFQKGKLFLSTFIRFFYLLLYAFITLLFPDRSFATEISINSFFKSKLVTASACK